MKTTHITNSILLTGALIFTGCAGGPLSTREKGAGVGALGGAATGGLVGAAVGHPGAVPLLVERSASAQARW